MAKRWSNHIISKDQLVDFEPTSLIASGDAWDKQLKRLWVKCVLQPSEKMVFHVQHKEAGTLEFSTFDEALNFYNEL